MIVSTKAQIIFISEVKSSKFCAHDIATRFNMNNAFVVPSRKSSGGLWLMWSDDTHLDVYTSSFHLILALATDRLRNQKFGLVCVYGDPYHRQTALIWSQVANFVYDNSNLPILCMGDMNDLMYDTDKSSPNINRNRMNAFRSFVKNCGLFDLGFSGPAFTWTNRRFSSKPLFQRLDRCLANTEWCSVYPNSNVFNMPLIYCFSDHAPILCSTDGAARKVKNFFKFENWWLKEPDFPAYAKSCWENTANSAFHNRTNKLARDLKIWCRKKKPLQDELRELEQKIKEVQSKPLAVQDRRHEADLMQRYEQTITKLNDYQLKELRKIG